MKVNYITKLNNMSKCKGIILCGGNGTRLRPTTLITNKHLLPVYDRPMCYYPLRTLIQAGIEDIMLITGKEHAGSFMNLLGSGKEFNVNLTYRVQEEAGGIAEALNLAKSFVGKDSMVVILGDNIIEEDIKKYVKKYENDHSRAKIFLKEVEDPSRFGVPKLEDGHIVEIIEKPKEHVSPYAVIGLYFYNPSVFHAISLCKKSGRGELEITDVNNWFLQNGLLDYETIKDFWSDAGTPESLFKASEYVKQNQEKFR